MDKSIREFRARARSFGDQKLAISWSQSDGAQILAAHGYIDLATVRWLDEALTAVRETPRKLIVDLTDVDFLGAIGLSILAEAGQRLGSDRMVFVTTLNSMADRLLTLAGFERSVRICHSLRLALQNTRN